MGQPTFFPSVSPGPDLRNGPRLSVHSGAHRSGHYSLNPVSIVNWTVVVVVSFPQNASSFDLVFSKRGSLRNPGF